MTRSRPGTIGPTAPLARGARCGCARLFGPGVGAIDVEIKRPGSTSYVYWQKRTQQTTGSFTPDAGPGKYSFRSRYRNLANWSASGWSSTVTIDVN